MTYSFILWSIKFNFALHEDLLCFDVQNMYTKKMMQNLEKTFTGIT